MSGYWVDNNSLQWIDVPAYEWELPAGEVFQLNQIWTDNDFVYAVTTSGLFVVDVDTSNTVAYVDYSGGFSTVWASDDNVYVGTEDDGVKYIEKTCISTNQSNPVDIVACLNDYDFTHNVSSDVVRYIHGSGETLAVVTYSGIDILNNGEILGYKSSTQMDDVEKCFFTSKGEVYYTKNTGGPALYKKSDTSSDWSEPDKNFVIENPFSESGLFLEDGVTINDIYVTVNTSSGTSNTLFVATSSGIYVYDEGLSVGDVYYSS